MIHPIRVNHESSREIKAPRARSLGARYCPDSEKRVFTVFTAASIACAREGLGHRDGPIGQGRRRGDAHIASGIMRRENRTV